MQNPNIPILRKFTGLALNKSFSFLMYGALSVALPLGAIEDGPVIPVPNANFGTVATPLTPSVDNEFGTITSPTGTLDGGTISQ